MSSEIFLILIMRRDFIINLLRNLHITYVLFLSDFNKTVISRLICEKSSDFRFHEGPSSESGIVPCGQKERETDGRTDMKKLIVAFSNFVKGPKNPFFNINSRYENKLFKNSIIVHHP
jgi:hypothetical protein